MIKINFLSDSDFEDYSEAIKEYESIWKADGEKIIRAWEETAGYRFKETFMNAIIYVKGGHSHPLTLKSGGTNNGKKTHLIHELGHRVLLAPRRISFKSKNIQPTSLENHKILDLVLLDVLESLYGKEFADNAIKFDCEHIGGIYKEAWEFALSFKTKEERQKKFKEMMRV